MNNMKEAAHVSRLPQGIRRVHTFLEQRGHGYFPVLFDDAANTAQQAADALNVQLGQIAKSIIFRRKKDDAAVLVIASGDHRVDEKKGACHLGLDVSGLGRADADFVREKTGFAIGGVAPVAHTCAPVTLLDRELLRFEVIWAAAGHPKAVFQLSPSDLSQFTHAHWYDVAHNVP